jgi:NADH:ubiquinone oxidoreductase subunit 6 (subunit J)
MDQYSFLFWTIGGLTVMSAVAVVVSQNIVRAAVWLLFTLAGTSGLFFLAGAYFVGATQLFVYVGGTLVLVVFGVMLTSQGPFVSLKTGAGEWVISLVVGLLLYGLIGSAVLLTDWKVVDRGVEDPKAEEPVSSLGLSLTGFEQATPEANLVVQPDRERPRASYLLPFEITSVLLLVALLGAAYLARAKRRGGAAS